MTKVKIVGSSTHMLSMLCVVDDNTYLCTMDPVPWETVALEFLIALLGGGELPQYLLHPYQDGLTLGTESVSYNGFTCAAPSAEIFSVWQPLLVALTTYAAHVPEWLCYAIQCEGKCIVPKPSPLLDGGDEAVQHIRYFMSCHPARPFKLVGGTGVYPRWTLSGTGRHIAILLPNNDT